MTTVASIEERRGRVAVAKRPEQEEQTEAPAPVRAPSEPEGWRWDETGLLPLYEVGVDEEGQPESEGLESTWTELDENEDGLHLQRGAIADAVSRNALYGDGSLLRFAARMRADASSVRDWLATHRRLQRLPAPRRERVLRMDLRYSHRRALNGVTDHAAYEELSQKAMLERWSTGRTASAAASWIELERQKNQPTLDEPETEDGEDGEEPPRAPSEPPDPHLHTRALLSRFVEWLREERGIGLVELDGGEVVQGEAALVEDYINDEEG